MITTINDIRSHVVEDAVDLISAIGVVKPLITGNQLRKIGREREQVAWFLRKLLSRNMILICARLHEQRGSGPAGETASIETLLEYAAPNYPRKG